MDSGETAREQHTCIILHFPLSTFHFQLSILHSPLSTLHYPLSILHFPLSTLHYPFSTIQMRPILLTILLFLSLLTVKAQDEPQDESRKPRFSGSVELTSKYLWRGQEYGTAPTIFPTLNFSVAGLNVYASGAYSFNNSYSEVDLGADYTFADVTIGLVDYYYPSAVGENDKYFNFRNRTTGHSLEAFVSYAPSWVPLTAMLATYFWGDDKKEDGSQAWSTYAELGYHHDFSERIALSVALGASLNRSSYNNFETGFSIVNIGLKLESVLYKGKHLSVPASVQYVINPQKEKSYISFTAGVEF